MKKICKSAILSILLLISTTDILFPQKEAIYPSRPVTLSQYLVSVMKGNLGYIAEQFNVSMAVADLKAARVFPIRKFPLHIQMKIRNFRWVSPLKQE